MVKSCFSMMFPLSCGDCGMVGRIFKQNACRAVCGGFGGVGVAKWLGFRDCGGQRKDV